MSSKCIHLINIYLHYNDSIDIISITPIVVVEIDVNQMKKFKAQNSDLNFV